MKFEFEVCVVPVYTLEENTNGDDDKPSPVKCNVARVVVKHMGRLYLWGLPLRG